MVHPNVLKDGGIDPKKYSGWAFGFGIERVIMMKYGLDDIRNYYSGDIRFLEQF
ncbi:MAG: Phenylalanine-tRNA ligase alpha subunit [Candidatus Roizmanbacteria bacterium GW2011_GWA2_35_19]|nr:MAG: Phenylalanine-tRNA ligase alpha subunit [Candidatus Roizmanbacteria bacterium GW2011_GWA2_35_19]